MMIKDKLNSGMKLSPSERQIADYIIAHPEEFTEMSIQEVSKQLYVSKSTIIRFAKKLGFAGHKELCLNLSRELFNTVSEEAKFAAVPFYENDTDTEIIDKLLNLHVQALKDTRYTINIPQLKKIAERIVQKRKIYILGMYESYLIASDFQYKLMNIGIDAIVPPVPGLFFRQISNIDEGELVLAVSFHGSFAEMLDVLQFLKKKKAYIIGLTGMGDSMMNSLASEIIRVNINESKPKIGAFSSRSAMSFILDIIYALVFSFGYEANLKRISEAETERRQLKTK